jgi:phosphate transport system permease protein
MKRKDYVAVGLVLFFVGLYLIPVLALIKDVVYNGLRVIAAVGSQFFVAPPPNPGDGLGGIGPALEGSLYMVALAVLMSGPISFLTGVFLAFYEKSPIAKAIRSALELIVEFPTIIVGIVVFSTFVVGFSLLDHKVKLGLGPIAGAIALAIVMLPYATIQINESLRIPRRLYEETAYALGLTQWQVIRVIVSAGKKGILTGLLLGFAKVIGETAPIIVVTSTTANVYLTDWNSPVTGVPVLIYTYAFSAYSNWIDVAWGASLALLVIVTATFVIVRLLSSWKR